MVYSFHFVSADVQVLMDQLGHVLVWHENRWVTVCGNQWDASDAAVVCRQLGFNNGRAFNRLGDWWSLDVSFCVCHNACLCGSVCVTVHPSIFLAPHVPPSHFSLSLSFSLSHSYMLPCVDWIYRLIQSHLQGIILFMISLDEFVLPKIISHTVWPETYYHTETTLDLSNFALWYSRASF